MTQRRPSLVVELQRATHAVGVRLEARLDRLGVSQGEIHVLALLADRTHHTVGELQRHVLHRPSTLTGLLDRLEQRGWVARTVNREDRRSYLISITPRGRAAAAAALRAIRAIEQSASRRVTARDLSGFLAVAHALSEDEVPAGRTDEFSGSPRSDSAKASTRRSARHEKS